MSSPEGEDVESILADLDRVEPVSFDLGTPELPEVDALRRLVALGPPIVPHLLERLRDEGASKQRIAYLVLALNRLGDVRALPILREIRENHQRRESKDEWDYAVIGQCNLAIEQLKQSKNQ
jgi:hypothetical protein